MASDEAGGSTSEAVRERRLLGALLEAIDAVPDGFVLYDADDRLVLCNRAFRDFNPELATLMTPGVSFRELIAAKATAALRSCGLEQFVRRTCGVDCGPTCVDWLDCRRGVHGRNHGVMFETTADGRWIRIDEHRTPSGMTVGLRTDLSDLRDVQDQLARSEAKFRTLFALAPIGIVRTSAEGRIVDANPAFAVVTGSSPDDERGFADLFDMRDRGGVFEDLRQGFGDGRYGPVERRLLGPEGSETVLSLEGTQVIGEDGVPYLWSILQDVTERKRGEARIWHAAHHDPLTGLPNRKRLAEVLDAALRAEGGAALFLVDLDNFKAVNDTFGHEVGDSVLVETAARLQEAVREGDFVARLGGDEFAVVLNGPLAPADALALAERLVDGLGRQVVRRGRAIRVGASVGVAHIPEHGDESEEILRSADHALLEAKRTGRNRVVAFTRPLGLARRRRVEARDTIVAALAEDRVHPHYQPIVDLESGAIRGFEALCRVRHGDAFEALTTDVFRDVDVGPALGARMIERVFADLATWGAAGLDVRRIDVNVCDADFADPRFEDRLLERLADWNETALPIGLEVTETTLLDLDLGRADLPRRLERLRARGVAIALDDFGTGHASLVHLKSLPVDRVKIDRAFVSDVVFDPASRAIVEALVRLGRGLGKEVVAEGIETAGQRRALLELGCRLGQGWYFAPPIEASEVVDLLASAERSVAAAKLGKFVSDLR